MDKYDPFWIPYQFRKKTFLKFLLYENDTLFSNICLLKKAYPKFLKIIRKINFDMGFQKITIRDR